MAVRALHVPDHPVGDRATRVDITETAESQQGLGTGGRVDRIQLVGVVLRDPVIDKEIRPVVVPAFLFHRAETFVLSAPFEAVE